MDVAVLDGLGLLADLGLCLQGDAETIHLGNNVHVLASSFLFVVSIDALWAAGLPPAGRQSG